MRVFTYVRTIEIDLDPNVYVVMANDKFHASELVNTKLRSLGYRYPTLPDEFEVLDTEEVGVTVLSYCGL